ncbi:MAG: hypothetical protein KJZ80_16785 [Hyphomicrobiaceae bacterium]|nr:hypothetical protein [Hyphomicrobiaceae bacterium]
MVMRTRVPKVLLVSVLGLAFTSIVAPADAGHFAGEGIQRRYVGDWAERPGYRHYRDYDEDDESDEDDGSYYVSPPHYAPAPLPPPAPVYRQPWRPSASYGPPAYEWLPPPRPSSCGVFRYWDGERCADARWYPPYIGPRW